MTEKLTTFDPSEGLTSDESIAAFMADAIESGDTGYIAHALGVVARAKGKGLDIEVSVVTQAGG